MRGPTTIGDHSSPPEWETLARYLAGESPDDEAARVRAWLDAHPGDAALLRTLDGALDRLAVASAMEIDVEDALRQVAERRDNPDVLPLRPRPMPSALPAPRWRAHGLRAAAVLLVAATGAVVWRATRRTADGAAGSATTYATAAGRRDSVRLPDGSRVVLAPGSRLVVAAGYGAPARVVELTGEGYFDVRHDDAHTFTVRAAGTVIRDVGTTFTVRTGDGNGAPRVRVAVRSGAVLLDGDDDGAARGVVLHEGDVGVVQADGSTVARQGTSTDDDVAWTQGRLVFREAPLAEVRDELRRWYGIELRVADPAIAGRHLTASFAGDSADRVLHVLGLALGARVERRGDTAVVRAGTPR
ncbi:FecR protein [Gemmatirosa kalamazoonensis]|uniref:FecR protein n=1 Tax=Gemmatirosa kalamazoonensis TaxID=861299 RepID=W0RDF2_9BACT|nr:FecR domain-containing protein [Gemmatirosa kalamazoonensis]AHG88340.1 FecR protein [Gemmatirosa kalamazoonensis]